jgi:hypothetical protein
MRTKEYAGMKVKTVDDVKKLILDNLPIEDRLLLSPEEQAIIDKVAQIWLDCVKEARTPQIKTPDMGRKAVKP